MSPEDEAKMTATILGDELRWMANYIERGGTFTPDELRWIFKNIERGAKEALKRLDPIARTSIKRPDRTMDVWVLTNKENGWFYCKDGRFSMSPDHAYVMTEEEATKLEADNTNLTKRKVQLVLTSN